MELARAWTCRILGLMSGAERDELEDVVASFGERERAGHTVELVTKSWRFAGISNLVEVRAWIAVGVFDGHRAGLLKMAGVEPQHLAGVPDARRLGLAFALGEVSLAEVKSLIAVLGGAETQPGDPQVTLVRTRNVDETADDVEPAQEREREREG